MLLFASSPYEECQIILSLLANESSDEGNPVQFGVLAQFSRTVKYLRCFMNLLIYRNRMQNFCWQRPESIEITKAKMFVDFYMAVHAR